MESSEKQRSQRNRRRERAQEMRQAQAQQKHRQNANEEAGSGEDDAVPPPPRRRKSSRSSSNEEDIIIIDGFAISSYATLDALENEGKPGNKERKEKKSRDRQSLEDSTNADHRTKNRKKLPNQPPPVTHKSSSQKPSVMPPSSPHIAAAPSSSASIPSLQNASVQVRAMICPLSEKGQGWNPVPMCYRTLRIGSGHDNDVCLSNYGHCNYVSGKHACIFYDEATGLCELLNYSEHGTAVGNLLYSLDCSEKNEVKKEVDPNDMVTMSADPFERRTQCTCKGSSSFLIGGTGAGWEDTARLDHGSVIKMGCLQFVFSITEFAQSSLSSTQPGLSLTQPS